MTSVVIKEDALPNKDPIPGHPSNSKRPVSGLPPARHHATIAWLATALAVAVGVSPRSTTWSWSRYGDALPNAPVQDLVVDRAHQRLVAATLGRGVWWTPLPATPQCIDADERSKPARTSHRPMISKLPKHQLEKPRQQLVSLRAVVEAVEHGLALGLVHMHRVVFYVP